MTFPGLHKGACRILDKESARRAKIADPSRLSAFIEAVNVVQRIHMICGKMFWVGGFICVKHCILQFRHSVINFAYAKVIEALFGRMFGSQRRSSGRGLERDEFAGENRSGSLPRRTTPVFARWRETHQFCSYDRAGDNYDWQYFPLYMETNGECVIFDAMGPGCLYRHHMNIWHAAPIYKGIHIRYYFDNEARPRVDMDVSTFFSTNNPLGIFEPPLAYDGKNRFRVLYHPMYFKKRLKVCLSALPGGGPATVLSPWKAKTQRRPDMTAIIFIGMSTRINYSLKIRGWIQWTPEAGRRIMPALLGAWSADFSASLISSAGSEKEESVTRKVRAGKTAVLWKSRKAGAITAFRVRITPTNSVDALFDTWLKISFDGAPSPQIEAPLGSFFGAISYKS